MAQTYSRAGNIDEAKSLLNQVLKAHPDRIEDLLMLGELYIRTDEIQQGLNLLWRGEAKKPSAHTELLMATAYMRLKQMPKAKELLDRARKRDPKNVEIFRAVANFQRQDRDYAGAIATLKSAPRMTAEIMGDLGYTYELAGDNKEAAVYYTRAANAERNNINMQLSAAQLEIARKWPKEHADELHSHEIQWIQQGINRERAQRGIVIATILIVSLLAGWAWQVVRPRCALRPGRL